MMKRLKIILAATVMVLLSSTTSGVFAQDSASPDFGNDGGPTPEGFWINNVKADKVKILYWEDWQPHYGAIFSSASITRAAGQKYVGPGGNAATCASSAGCIDRWNWHGAPPVELLLPKGGWVVDWAFGERTNPDHYEANLFAIT
ncbi:MAG: hypothetical protein GFH27_549313n81 [Chloroflexi bacterium AL-W]|nr:hypothetical protein [Chloroflexi bacterium AL-N1]NOK69504.1 hypothetical protein [Chloroflexi bacterium AL-N10]NOK77469.1 hypothetical protein [Chloroflexi bacterium AL-N5]NOK84320.1 hypothetical protein [Chloroflexi bacterium AL-W]NOK91514.1 hypothetical protein [Chloroflexi bacterium AL-N15]